MYVKAVLTFAMLAAMATPTAAESDSTFELYGHVMLDAGYNTGQSDPNWTDVLRPTKLPAFENEFGPDGNNYMSVRQSRFGVRSSTPTDIGELTTIFEFELFGTGVDEGQTTFRLRHAYGQLGKFGAGQYWSPFMDIDVFPNTLEYWGPNGMVFFRNVQFRYMPIQGDTRMTIALERPGASADGGVYDAPPELADVFFRFPLPDLSAEYRQALDRGYVELAGMLRYIEWDDLGADAFDISDETLGWGINLSTNIDLTDVDKLRGQVVYGKAIQNYMNDASADIGLKAGTDVPFIGVPLPVLGVVAFIDHSWSERFSSSFGYSLVDIDNKTEQVAEAFARGHYAIGNLLYYPTNNVTAGVELQYGRRENVGDFESDALRVQFSFKYSFSRSL